MNVIPFPKARARTPATSVLADWPSGQCGVELEELAQMLYRRGQANGKGCTLEKARWGALTAFREMEDEMALRERVRQERAERIAELLVDRAERNGVDLHIEAARAAAYSGEDPSLTRIMAATHREAKARIARSKK